MFDVHFLARNTKWTQGAALSCVEAGGYAGCTFYLEAVIRPAPEYFCELMKNLLDPF